MAEISMPKDGSAKLSTVERAVFLATALSVLGAGAGFVVALVVALVGVVLGTSAGPDTPRWPLTDERAGALVVQGGHLSWEVSNACAQGPDACERAMREANDNPYGVRVFEDGTITLR